MEESVGPLDFEAARSLKTMFKGDVGDWELALSILQDHKFDAATVFDCAALVMNKVVKTSARDTQWQQMELVYQLLIHMAMDAGYTWVEIYQESKQIDNRRSWEEALGNTWENIKNM
jgi:hypothetical protein